MRRRTVRKWGSFAAVLGLAIRLAIAALHVPPAVAGALPGDDFLSQLVLCTSSGLRVVQLDESGQPVDPDQSPSSAPGCPICTSLSAAPFALAPDAVELNVPHTIATALDDRPVLLSVGRKPLVVRGRDPPARA